MKKRFPARTLILAGSLLLQLSTFCFHSRGAAGDVDLSFDPGSGVNGLVNAMLVQPDGKVIIGGEFSTVKGLTRKNVARLNADGTGDSSFTSLLNFPVYSLALQADGKVLVGGDSSGQNNNFGLTRLNPDGSADTEFNTNAFLAIASTDPYYPARVNTIVVQPDGKVLHAGLGLHRLNSNGTLDNSFIDAVAGADPTSIYSMALQADGKVILNGYLWDHQYGLVRLGTNGNIDNTFHSAVSNLVSQSIVVQPDGKVLIGDRGVVRLNANGSVDPTFNPGPVAGSVLCMALQPNGKVIVGGQFVSINGQSRTNLARLNADGSLDLGFQNGTGGVSGEGDLNYGPSVKAIVLQTNGTMLISGAFTTVNGTNRNRMARLQSDGSLDAAFQPGHRVGPISALVVQADGKVLIGGATGELFWENRYVLTFINGTNHYASARLHADGSPDPTFIAATNFNPDLLAVRRYDDCPGAGYGCYPLAWASTVAVQPDGKVLIGGVVRTEVSGDEFHEYYYSPILGRFYADGSLDTNFAVSPFGGNQEMSKVIVQPDGKILVCGSFTSINGTNRPGMARLNTNGTLDLSFAPATGASSMALQPDGKVLIAGHGFARLNANGSFDNSFNSITGTNGYGSALALQPDGKILIGGSFTNIHGTNLTSIARLNANGSLDGTFNAKTTGGGLPYSIVLQSDGNILVGGDFLTVNGVFRPYVARLYGDAFVLPSVNIARANAFVIVSWPASAAGYQLQQTTNLSQALSWIPVAQPSLTNAGQISVTVPATTGNKFFRLKSP